MIGKKTTIRSSFVYNNKEYNYIINYKRIKNIYCRIKDDTLIISAPIHTNPNKIIDWLTHDSKLLNRLMSMGVNKNKLVLENHLKLNIIEEEYEIVLSDKNSVDKTHEIIYLSSLDNKNLIKILKVLLSEYCDYKTDLYFKKMYGENEKFLNPNTKYKLVKSYHGQYSKKTNTITYNIGLALMQKELIDYVIVHELCHIKHLNHSKDFHALLDIYYPNNKYYKKKLREEWINLC